METTNNNNNKGKEFTFYVSYKWEIEDLMKITANSEQEAREMILARVLDTEISLKKQLTEDDFTPTVEEVAELPRNYRTFLSNNNK